MGRWFNRSTFLRLQNLFSRGAANTPIVPLKHSDNMRRGGVPHDITVQGRLFGAGCIGTFAGFCDEFGNPFLPFKHLWQNAR